MDGNLYNALCPQAGRESGHIAIDTAARQWSGDELTFEVERLAAALEAIGARPGDRVAVQVDKSPYALFLYLACLRGGMVYVPMNTAYRAAEIEYFLRDAEPAVFVVRPENHEASAALAASIGKTSVVTLGADGLGTLADAAPGRITATPVTPRAGDDLAALLYTSGTTGRPKGAMLTHRNLHSNATTLVDLWGFDSDDVLVHALPLFHVHGLFVACHCALLAGATLRLLPRFDASTVIEAINGATVLMGVPTFYTRLLEVAEFGAAHCASMRLFISGSAPLLESTFETFRQRTGHTILERYGMSETNMLTSNPLHGDRKPGTVGPPLPDVELRVVDDNDRTLPASETGNIQVRGPNVFAGYWRQPERTREEFTDDGWFRTGDIGRIDDDGYVAIVGRARDLVISGGYNVYPKEVELCLDRLPGVSESAVIGIPHADLGETVTAVVVAENDAVLIEADMVALLKNELAGYKVPRRIHVVTELPRNAMGKVQKNLLRERFTTP